MIDDMKHEKHTIGFDAKRANANRTGLGNYSRFVIDALAEACGDRAYLRLYIPKRKANAEFDALTARENVESLVPRGGMWQRLSALWRTVHVASDAACDSVALFHGLSNELPLGLARRSIRSVVTIHDLIFLRYPAYYKFIDRKIYEWKFRSACRRADRIIAVSECTKRDIVKFFGIDPDKIDVVYQGCDTMFAEPVTEEHRQKAAARYGLPERYILNVGTLEERKNLMAIVEALALLPQHIHLVAVGRATPYLDRVRRRMAELGVTDRVHLLHDVAYRDLPAVYAAADVFVYPSRFEGFGIPIIEAQSIGVPVVAATGSCLEEAGGDAALYVSPDDVWALANAVKGIVADDELRRSMVERGREQVRRFDAPCIARDIMKCYKHIGIDLTDELP